VLNSQAVDGHQMYFGGSVVGNWYMDLAHIPPLIFTGGQKVQNLVWFSTSLNFEPISEFWNKNAMLRWSLYNLIKFGEVGFTHHWEISVLSDSPLKICTRKRAKSSITQSRIIRFRSNFVESLNTGDPKCWRSSRSRGQRSRSQHVITCAKIRKIINNSAGIARYRSNFVHNLITWCLLYHKLSRATGQRSRSDL